MVNGYNAQEADDFWTKPREPICPISKLDNCYQCHVEDCEFWEETNSEK